jgi:hypothetical protein
MRDCVFLVADSQIQAMLRGFLGRDSFHLSLGCGAFDVDPTVDIVVDPNRDPGVYSRGFQMLASFTTTHRRAVVILDAEWEGSPGAGPIRDKIGRELEASWGEYIVIVLEPEIEAWLWQDNQHVVGALGAGNYAALRAELEARNLWRAGELKPFRPKEAVEFVLKRARIPRSAALYGQIAGRVSVKACVDPAFLSLRETLEAWFGAPS